IWQERGVQCATPSQVIDAWEHEEAPIYDAHSVISWADTERDLSAWQGNQIQTAALKAIHDLGPLVKATGNPDLIRTWRKLQTSDHFYYMCTKYWNDGDVHK
ncbi:MAG: alpha-amylase, partial [Candidatus Peregrinibacteria bacterium]